MEKSLERTVQEQRARIEELEKALRKKDRGMERLKSDIEREKLYANTRANQAAAHLVAQRVRDRYFRLLLSNSPDIIICFNRTGHIVFRSNAFEKLSGGEVGGMMLDEALKDSQDEEFVRIAGAALEKTLETGAAQRFPCESGAGKHVANFIPMTSEEGKVEGAMAIFHDITEIEFAREAAENASRSKSEFLSNMSHEMRTPLNAIIGMAAIAARSQGIERKDYCIKRINAASSHLLGLINDVLDMSKIEANMMELSPVAFRFDAMIRSVTNVVKVPMDEKRQRLGVSVDPLIPPVLIGDSQRIVQIVTNLLSNAAKFTPEEGDIRLSVFLDESSGDLCLLRIAVSDTGIGIKGAHKESLFSPFQQADSGTARKFGGTGLGLPISKRLVEMMGGRIWFDSEPGRGTTFQFTFRAERGDEAMLEGEAAGWGEGAAGADFSRFRALLVDDVEINREIVISLLEHTGLAIDCAENGVKALEMVRSAERPYDIIFMDLQMPEMDGYETTREIRALEASAGESRHYYHVPIVAMTANVFREDVEKCLRAGMDNHIGKPIAMADLSEKLNMYLGNWSPLC